MVLHLVLESGPITALAAASPRWKVTISGRRTSGPCGGRKEGPQGRQGSVTPLVVRERGTINSSLGRETETEMTPLCHRSTGALQHGEGDGEPDTVQSFFRCWEGNHMSHGHVLWGGGGGGRMGLGGEMKVEEREREGQ